MLYVEGGNMNLDLKGTLNVGCMGCLTVKLQVQLTRCDAIFVAHKLVFAKICKTVPLLECSERILGLFVAHAANLNEKL